MKEKDAFFCSRSLELIERDDQSISVEMFQESNANFPAKAQEVSALELSDTNIAFFKKLLFKTVVFGHQGFLFYLFIILVSLWKYGYHLSFLCA